MAQRAASPITISNGRNSNALANNAANNANSANNRNAGSHQVHSTGTPQQRVLYAQPGSFPHSQQKQARDSPMQLLSGSGIKGRCIEDRRACEFWAKHFQSVNNASVASFVFTLLP